MTDGSLLEGMARTAEIIDAFERMLETVGGDIHHVVFDLDATLGDDPGWYSDAQSLQQYVHYPTELSLLLRHLRANSGIESVLVSRNGSFCGPTYDDSAAQAKRLGFAEVAACSRVRPKQAKPAFVANAVPSRVLLIDDQPAECELAAKNGSRAVLCDQEPLLKTLLTQGSYKFYVPTPPLSRRRRATGGRRR